MICKILKEAKLTSVLSKIASRKQTVEIVDPGHEVTFRLRMTEHAHLQIHDDTSRTENV